MRLFMLLGFLVGCGNEIPAPCVGCSDRAAVDPGQPLRVFVTAKSYAGDFGKKNDALAAADSYCTSAAFDAGLGGRWRAWLSAGNVNARDRIAGNGPWNRIDGQRAFDNLAQLGSFPKKDLGRDQYDELADENVWTGSSTGGLRNSDTCSDWTDVYSEGLVGWPGVPSQWTQYTTWNCAEGAHFYCFEQ